MTINDHEQLFAGLPVRSYEPEQGLAEAAATAWRLTLGFDNFEAKEPLTNLLAQFLREPEVSRVKAVVIGAWEDISTGGGGSQSMVEALVGAKGKLPALEAIFFGDVIVEESEISWIAQSDMGPLLAAYPRLQHFRVRGGQGLALGGLRHPALRSLIVETGGLSGEVVRQVAAADLPELTHLELWLGDSGYGATWRMEDLAPILGGARFPKLQVLGLRNSEEADRVAAAIAGAPLLGRLRVLDLSLGNLGDEGAEALLAAPATRRLARLDLHHHYLSDETAGKLAGLGIEVNLDEKCDGDEDERYISVSE